MQLMTFRDETVLDELLLTRGCGVDHRFLAHAYRLSCLSATRGFIADSSSLRIGLLVVPIAGIVVLLAAAGFRHGGAASTRSSS